MWEEIKIVSLDTVVGSGRDKNKWKETWKPFILLLDTIKGD